MEVLGGAVIWNEYYAPGKPLRKPGSGPGNPGFR